MKININDQPVELKDRLTLEALLTQMRYSPEGTALAINQIIIPRSQWPQQWVNEGDDILLFQAIAGG
jgi:sulfur carrier protein